MKDREIIEAMAKLDGYEFDFKNGDGNSVFTRGGEGYYVIDYLADHNAAQRVLGAMSCDDFEAVEFYIKKKADRYNMGACWFLLQATCRQKCVAILKAKGLLD